MTEPTHEEKLKAMGELVKGPYTRIDEGRIDCTLIHPEWGEIPFTASAFDSEEHGNLLYTVAHTRMLEEGD